MYTENYWLNLCVEIIRFDLEYEWDNVESMNWFNILSTHAYSVFEYAYSDDYSSFNAYDDLVIVSNTLGYGFRCNGNYNDSLTCYKRALSMQEKTLGKLSALRSTLYYNIAWLYEEKLEYDLSLEWYMKDLSISEAVFGREGISTAQTYNSIGALYIKKHNYKKARSFLQRALYIFKTKLGVYNSNTATVCNNIANLYAEKKLYEKAIEWYQKDIEISKKISRKENTDIAITYNNIGLIYYEQGIPTVALDWYEKAIRIMNNMFTREHPKFDNIIKNAEKAYELLLETSNSFPVWLDNITDGVN